MIKRAVQIGDERLRKKSKKVPQVNALEVRSTIKNLIDSMRHYGLVGMTAPQIGVSLQIFVTEIRKTKIRRNEKDLDSLRIFINPRIVNLSVQQTELFEGCGSINTGDLFGLVKRPKTVTIKAVNENGELVELQAHGLLAKVIQHEIDHLN